MLRLDSSAEEDSPLPEGVARAISNASQWSSFIISLMGFTEKIGSDPDPELHLEYDGIGLENITLEQLERTIRQVSNDIHCEISRAVSVFDNGSEFSDYDRMEAEEDLEINDGPEEETYAGLVEITLSLKRYR